MSTWSGELLPPEFDDETAEGLVGVAGLAAELAARQGNPPFGCLFVQATAEGGVAVMRAGENQVHTTRDVTAHAEMEALRVAQRTNVDVGHCALVSNVESCPGCFSFALKAGVQYFYFGGRGEPTAQPYVPLEVMAQSMRVPPRLWYSRDPLWTAQVKNARQGGIANISQRLLLPADMRHLAAPRVH